MALSSGFGVLWMSVRGRGEGGGGISNSFANFESF